MTNNQESASEQADRYQRYSEIAQCKSATASTPEAAEFWGKQAQDWAQCSKNVRGRT